MQGDYHVSDVSEAAGVYIFLEIYCLSRNGIKCLANYLTRIATSSLRSLLSPVGVMLVMLCAVMTSAAQQPVLVSAANGDVAPPGAGRSYGSSVSADGRYVAFHSFADNLVSQRDSNEVSDVFVRDLQTGTTTLVSVNTAGTGTGNRESHSPIISANGRYVIFRSEASDLVAVDQDNPNGTVADVFVRDLQTGTTVLVSRNVAGTGGGSGISIEGGITPDGRFIVFQSSASNLVPNDTNVAPDIFVYDLQTNTNTLVSVNSAGTNGGNSSSLLWSSSPGGSVELAPISADGRYVVFVSGASDLVPGTDSRSSNDVFVRDLQTGTTRLVSVNSAGTGTSNHESTLGLISADGRYVVFLSSSSNLVSVSDNNNESDLFVRDLQTNTTRLITINSSGTAAGNAGGSSEPVISADGRYVAFIGFASDYVAGDNNDARDVFVRDLQTDTTQLVSLDQTNSTSANGISNDPTISADGRFVAFVSTATNLVSTTDANGAPDIFVRDLQTNTTRLASINSAGTGSALGGSIAPRLSANGGIVTFESPSTEFAANDGNNHDDVFAVALDAQAKFSSPHYMVNEQDGTATVTVTRNASSTGPLTIKFFTGNGSATGGADFTVIDQTLNFAAGETSKDIVIPIINDTTDEASESVNLIISDFSTGSEQTTLSTATLLINDEDPPPALSIEDVTITEGDSNTVNAVFKVNLSEVSGMTILVDVTPASGTATQFSDFHVVPTKLIIPAGSASGEVSVTISGDLSDEFDETFTMTLSNPMSATISRAQATGTIVDNDAPPTLTILNATSVEGNNGATEAIVLLVMQSVASSKPVSVNYATADLSATAGSDYTARSGTLTFAPGQRTRGIIVPIIGDTTPEADEIFFVNLSNPTNATIAVDQARGDDYK